MTHPGPQHFAEIAHQILAALNPHPPGGAPMSDPDCVVHRYGDACPGGHGATGLNGVDLDDQLTPSQADSLGYTADMVAAYYEGFVVGGARHLPGATAECPHCWQQVAVGRHGKFMPHVDPDTCFCCARSWQVAP